MTPPSVELLGSGVYGLAESARLSGVHPATIRRWVKGYRYVARGETRSSPPVFRSDLDASDAGLALTFLDLMEARAVHFFRTSGVNWPTIRRAYERASEIVGHDHPFSTRRFLTDGRTILQDLAKRRMLLDLQRLQLASRDVLAPYLLLGLDFDARGQAERWWPNHKRAGVVLDPRRCFGQPIVAAVGIPTRILSDSFAAEQSLERVARWYEVPARAVRLAVEFEQQLAA